MKTETTETSRAEAWKVTYGPKWKIGQSPQQEKLGELIFPDTATIEEMEQALHYAFPTATDCRLFNRKGYWFCASCL